MTGSRTVAVLVLLAALFSFAVVADVTPAEAPAPERNTVCESFTNGQGGGTVCTSPR